MSQKNKMGDISKEVGNTLYHAKKMQKKCYEPDQTMNFEATHQIKSEFSIF
jgi:hypothetical protein